MRYFNTSRLLRKRKEWLKKPYIGDEQLENMSPTVRREVMYWLLVDGWERSAHLHAFINPFKRA